jgi:hypothetical protein
MINKQSTLLERVDVSEYIRDESILNSTHPLDRAIVTALDLCFEFDPNIRASARQIQELFRKALDEVNDS